MGLYGGGGVYPSLSFYIFIAIGRFLAGELPLIYWFFKHKNSYIVIFEAKKAVYRFFMLQNRFIMIFTSKNASIYAYNTVFTTPLPKEFHPYLKIWLCPCMLDDMLKFILILSYCVIYYSKRTVICEVCLKNRFSGKINANYARIVYNGKIIYFSPLICTCVLNN